MANQDEITTQPDHRDAVGALNGQDVQMGFRLRNFIDDLVQKLNIQIFANTGIRVPSYTVSDLPTVPDITEPSIIFVSDETGGSVLAFSNGTNWLRCTDRSIVT